MESQDLALLGAPAEELATSAGARVPVGALAVVALLAAGRGSCDALARRSGDRDHGRRFGDDLPRRDLELACEVDRFDAAVEVHRRRGELLVEAARSWSGT